MSGKIDYNEIDKAVLQASKPKTSKVTKVGASDSIAQKQSYPPRTRYMDFIARPRRKTSISGAAQPSVSGASQSASGAEQAPRRVARFAPAAASMPNYRIASSHAATKPHSIPAKTIKATPVAKPTPVVKPVASVKPPVVVKPVARVAKPTPVTKVPAQPVQSTPVITRAAAKPALTEEEKIQAKNTAAAASAAVATLQKAPSSPNANNYSLGVKSPFIRTDAKVEKRPLGNSGNEYVSDDNIDKNTYESKKDDTKTVKSKKKTKVVANKQTKSKGWVWPMIIVLIIAAGGGLGYLAYRVLENAF